MLGAPAVLLLLLAPLLLLASAVVALAEHGPLGWLAAAALVAASAWASRWTWRVTLRWWRSTKAPEQPASTFRGPRR